jgi:CelD/BcsL family acetyltransferase involved in cellulose biosynthesis
MTSSPISSAALTSRVLSTADEFKSIAVQWRELFGRAAQATPFQHPDWLLCWIDAFRPRELIGVAVFAGSRLIGFAPLLIYPRGNERVLAFAGGGVSDYLGILAEEAAEAEVWNEVLRTAQSFSEWTLLELTDLSCSSTLVAKYQSTPSLHEHDVCYVLTLPSGGDELLHVFSKRQRANLRNARSRTRREGDAVIEVAGVENLSDFMDDLFRLHGDRWTHAGQSGVLSDDRVRQFHLAAAPALLSSGILRLYRMRLDGRTIAAIYTLYHRDSVFCYLQGFDPRFSHLSPGTQLMFGTIQDAVRLGMRRFDFLRGEEAYKLHWRPEGEPTYRVELARNVLEELFRSAA